MLDLKKLKEEQLKLAKKIVLTDSFETIKKIAGVDYIYTDKDIICAIVVIDYKTLQIIESKYSAEPMSIPYIPGFLSYRIAPVTLKTIEKLVNRPDLLMIAGNGIMHPRQIGAASAIGLFIDLPTIGIAKKRLCGEEKGDTVYLGKDVIGKKLETRDKAKPIYVSQGHKISLTSTIEITKNMLKGHKLPEPLYFAHRYGNKIKSKLKEGNGNGSKKDNNSLKEDNGNGSKAENSDSNKNKNSTLANNS
ncbi:endonuclease V [Candidatus Woesearchaeota archaeon]|nr:endonuclease V [Candidatus Woesearchaeota archaeon]